MQYDSFSINCFTEYKTAVRENAFLIVLPRLLILSLKLLPVVSVFLNILDSLPKIPVALFADLPALFVYPGSCFSICAAC